MSANKLCPQIHTHTPRYLDMCMSDTPTHPLLYFLLCGEWANHASMFIINFIALIWINCDITRQGRPIKKNRKRKNNVAPRWRGGHMHDFVLPPHGGHPFWGVPGAIPIRKPHRYLSSSSPYAEITSICQSCRRDYLIWLAKAFGELNPHFFRVQGLDRGAWGSALQCN